VILIKLPKRVGKNNLEIEAWSLLSGLDM